MKVLKCKRGNISERDKYGHCLCNDCKKYRYKIQITNPNRREYIEEWRNKNRDKVNLYAIKWNDKNKEKRNRIIDLWRKNNPDKVKVIMARAGKKWASNNKGKRNAIDMRRKAALLQRTPSWANLEKIKAIYIQAEKITKETGIPHEVDHIIPLQGKFVSGLHVHNNLQILPKSENRSKKNTIKRIIWSPYVF